MTWTGGLPGRFIDSVPSTQPPVEYPLKYELEVYTYHHGIQMGILLIEILVHLLVRCIERIDIRLVWGRAWQFDSRTSPVRFHRESLLAAGRMAFQKYDTRTPMQHPTLCNKVPVYLSILCASMLRFWFDEHTTATLRSIFLPATPLYQEDPFIFVSVPYFFAQFRFWSATFFWRVPLVTRRLSAHVLNSVRNGGINW